MRTKFLLIVGAGSTLRDATRAPAIFEIGDAQEPTLTVLKLHGSLNWLSVHRSRAVAKNAILNASRPYRITPRSRITPGLTFTVRRTQYTFPLIIPPVSHKAGIDHRDICALWSKAETALKAAHRIVVFGYSCPEMDFERANLIGRTIRQNTHLEEFNVIDPDPSAFQRYVDLMGLDTLYYFRTAQSYMRR